jgi:ubiquinone/menaquinone biosynthesis C-methylase UbiE
MSTAMHLTADDYTAIKIRQRAVWSGADYAAVATTIQYMSELLCETMDIHAGQCVLDVATGSGNAAIAAARRGARVTGLDYSAVLLDWARRRAEAERVAIDWVEADAEALPFPDGSFDAVTSVVGVMFAPDQSQAAAELVRVCRPSGRVVVASWTPDGFIGALLRLVGGFVAPPAGLTPPTHWGTRDGMTELMGRGTTFQWFDRAHLFRFLSARQFADFFIANYGPTERAAASLDEHGRREFTNAITALADRWNRATDGTLVVPGAYLEAHAQVS